MSASEVQRSILYLSRRREEYIEKIDDAQFYERGIAFGLSVALAELRRLEERLQAGTLIPHAAGGTYLESPDA